MAIRVNQDGTVVIERVLKVTKELDSLNFTSFESNFNRMMCDYSTEFEMIFSPLETELVALRFILS